MPTSLTDFIWFILVAVLAIVATLIGMIYKGIENRLEDHDKRIRNLELTISEQLAKIIRKLEIS